MVKIEEQLNYVGIQQNSEKENKPNSFIWQHFKNKIIYKFSQVSKHKAKKIL